MLRPAILAIGVTLAIFVFTPKKSKFDTRSQK